MELEPWALWGSCLVGNAAMIKNDDTVYQLHTGSLGACGLPIQSVYLTVRHFSTPQQEDVLNVSFYLSAYSFCVCVGFLLVVLSIPPTIHTHALRSIGDSESALRSLEIDSYDTAEYKVGKIINGREGYHTVTTKGNYLIHQHGIYFHFSFR